MREGIRFKIDQFANSRYISISFPIHVGSSKILSLDQGLYTFLDYHRTWHESSAKLLSDLGDEI